MLAYKIYTNPTKQGPFTGLFSLVISIQALSILIGVRLFWSCQKAFANDTMEGCTVYKSIICP